HVGQHPHLVGQRFTALPVGRDSVTDKPAGLRALVVHGDRVAPRGELAGGDQPGRAGAEHGDAAPVPPRPGPRARTAPEGRIGRVSLKRADRNRWATLGVKDAGALAQDLDGANSAAAAQTIFAAAAGSSAAISAMNRGTPIPAG